MVETICGKGKFWDATADYDPPADHASAHVSGHRTGNVGVYRYAHAVQESSLQRLACLHHCVVWLTATPRNDVDDATCAREEKSGRRQENATHVECRSASSTAVWWRRVWHAPRVDTNARVISQWAGAEYDYCFGSEDCSDDLTWNSEILSLVSVK